MDLNPSLKQESLSMKTPSSVIMKKPLNYSNDPTRSNNILNVRKAAPFNAEPPLPKLVDEYCTPEDVFFVRTHGPMPILQGDRHEFIIDGMVKKPVKLTVRELKENFEKVEIMATIQV